MLHSQGPWAGALGRPCSFPATPHPVFLFQAPSAQPQHMCCPSELGRRDLSAVQSRGALPLREREGGDRGCPAQRSAPGTRHSEPAGMGTPTSLAALFLAMLWAQLPDSIGLHTLVGLWLGLGVSLSRRRQWNALLMVLCDPALCANQGRGLCSRCPRKAGAQLVICQLAHRCASLSPSCALGQESRDIGCSAEVFPAAPVLYLRQQKAGTGRVKRAWVIPPISVSENHKRIPHLLVQIKSDKQQPGGVVYSIKGPGVDEEPRGVFSIDKLSGKVYLNTMLDREKNDHFRLQAFALDLGGGPLEDPTDLEIVVMDQNDNRPLFRQDVFSARVVEGAAPGTFVMKAEATDADDPETDNAVLRYSIQEPALKGLFEMDELSGEIRTAQVRLDREVVGVYNLTLQVADMSGEGLTTTASAVIYVEDINDNPPEFSTKEFFMEAPENKEGVVIGQLTVRDKDLPGSPNWLAKFTILEGDPEGAFTIQTDPFTNDGIVSLVKALDHEQQDHFELLVSVQNQSPLELSAPTAARALATVRVQVLDANEAPFFRENPWRGRVDEGAPPGMEITMYRASDPDTHQAQELRYSQAFSLDSWLQIDPESGLVRTRDTVPTRAKFPEGWYTAQILACDNGNPPLTATGTLSIEVVEVNDHAPLLLPRSGELCQQGGSLVLSATDQDLAPHAEPFHFRFGTSGTPLAHNWSLSRTNATHVLLQPQGEVAEGLHVLPLLISDSGRPPREQEQLLNVSVCVCSQEGACQARAAAVVGTLAGLSFGALMIILSSVALLLLLALLVAGWEHARRQAFRKSLLGASLDDLRDNVLNYDEQGGGEEDQDAYDINQLRNPDLLFPPPSPRIKPPLRKDHPYGYGLPQYPRRVPACPSDIEDFINEGLEAADADPAVPPYDTALIYDYEGDGSAGGSLSSILSSLADEDQDYDYLNEWGPRFRRLAELYGQ
uniref:cadherin-15 n=1 Tax=Euleptes europaea TaxID=460621 RepID=UPI0025409559|nr:cadherin-15 [Euleptes europaea]